MTLLGIHCLRQRRLCHLRPSTVVPVAAQKVLQEIDLRLAA